MEDIKDDINNSVVENHENNLSTVTDAICDVKGKIIDKAFDKIDNDKIIDKHADKLAEIADQSLQADTEKERLKVEQSKADNKAEKQRIKNELIELKTNAIKLKRERKQALKEQRANHKKRNDDIAWEKYKDKLEKMKYTYVPNMFILRMLLFFDGIVGFFNGVGEVSKSIMKALRWFIIIAIILIVIFIIPVTRNWFINLLGFNG